MAKNISHRAPAHLVRGKDGGLAEGDPFDVRGSKKRGIQLAVCQNLVPLVNIKIAGKWMFIPLNMVFIGIDPYPTDLQLWPFTSFKY